MLFGLLKTIQDDNLKLKVVLNNQNSFVSNDNVSESTALDSGWREITAYIFKSKV